MDEDDGAWANGAPLFPYCFLRSVISDLRCFSAHAFPEEAVGGLAIRAFGP